MSYFPSQNIVLFHHKHPDLGQKLSPDTVARDIPCPLPCDRRMGAFSTPGDGEILKTLSAFTTIGPPGISRKRILTTT